RAAARGAELGQTIRPDRRLAARATRSTQRGHGPAGGRLGLAAALHIARSDRHPAARDRGRLEPASSHRPLHAGARPGAEGRGSGTAFRTRHRTPPPPSEDPAGRSVRRSRVRRSGAPDPRVPGDRRLLAASVDDRGTPKPSRLHPCQCASLECMNTATEKNVIGVWPGLHYRDRQAALKFLTEGLGFTVIASYEGAVEGSIAHA